jgi:hypothetical protein
MAIFKRGLGEGVFARFYRKLLHSFYANDLWIDLRLHAKREAVAYIIDHMQEAMVLPDRLDLLKFALSRAPAEGLVLEFGVEKGASLRHLASLTPRQVHGFDSFEGLPGDWRGTKEAAGAFSRRGQLSAGSTPLCPNSWPRTRKTARWCMSIATFTSQP